MIVTLDGWGKREAGDIFIISKRLKTILVIFAASFYQSSQLPPRKFSFKNYWALTHQSVFHITLVFNWILWLWKNSFTQTEHCPYWLASVLRNVPHTTDQSRWDERRTRWNAGKSTKSNSVKNNMFIVNHKISILEVLKNVNSFWNQRHRAYAYSVQQTHQLLF